MEKGWEAAFCWEEDAQEVMSTAVTVLNWTMIVFATIVIVIGKIFFEFQIETNF